ncbi:MAG: ComEC/Rec2 family competence protein [Malacoplasma sp.]
MGKVLNFKIDTLVLAIFSFSFFAHNKEIFLCLFIILVIFMFVRKQKIFDYYINIFVACLFSFVYSKFNNTNTVPFNYIFNWIIGIDLRETIIDHVNDSFSIDSANFIKLLIFNIKENPIKDFYKKLSELSISHLVVVSGFHLSIIPIILSKLTNNKKISVPINLVTMFFLNYLTAFSMGSFRALLFYIFSLSKKTKNNTFSLSLLTTMIIAPLSSLLISLHMSYLAVFAIQTSKIKNNNLYLRTIVTSLTCTLFLVPFIGYFAGKVSMFFIFYSFIFTPLILFSYFLTLIFFWFPYYEFLLKYLVLIIFNLVDLLSAINAFIPIVSNGIFLTFFYWTILFFVFEKNIASSLVNNFKFYILRNI